MSARGMMPHIPAGPAIDRTVIFGNLPADANEIWLRSILTPIGKYASEIPPRSAKVTAMTH
ncbi:hypothetical protein OC835_006649 [Tilletia horrida]|uniref:RRM domain-containing protein n=1 Tax=Tilletia horrida TaxID=155126 RepID=A0AAN6GKA7_9BASI|nr:hypothetical protein OC835_006649 [Tilletia horrida]KAK0538506.1 hypothetical protein OC842_001286 [Tilletia horrida]KAK0558473.1 hypothetical protein OC844_005119 [Tilletia horrida]